MTTHSNPRRAKRGKYTPQQETLALLKTSGNSINGVGEKDTRRPSPFFWHPADQHPFGELQVVARQSSGSARVQLRLLLQHIGIRTSFLSRKRRTELRRSSSVLNWSHLRWQMRPTAWASPLWIRSTCLRVIQWSDPWVVVLAIGPQLRKVEGSSFGRNNERRSLTDVADQYGAARVVVRLANWIRSQGYNRQRVPGPRRMPCC